MINVILFLSMYPVIFILYYVQKADGKFKRRTLFGIRVSKDWISAEECEALADTFRHKMNRCLLIFSLIPLVTIPIPYFSINMTIWMIWLFAAIVAFMLPYGQGYQELLHIKQERIPASAETNIFYTELKGAGVIRAIKGTDLLLPMLLSIGLAVFSLFYLHGERYEMYNVLIVIFAACTPLFYACAILMDKMKTKVISLNSDVNVNYARANKKIWKTFWGACMWLNTLFTAIILGLVYLTAFTESFTLNFIIWGSIAYCLLTLIMCIYLWNRKNTLDKQYEDKMDIPDDNDENAWIGGILYYNPRDSHVMVNKKYGIGTTVNLATPVGKGNIVFIALVLLSIPVLCVWIMLEEFTPISLSLENEALVAVHWKEDYNIPTFTIENLSLVDEVPKSTKVSGTGMDTLKKGTFRNSEDGKVQLFLNPQNELFLRFTSGETIYYMSGFDDAETREIYEQLK